MPGYFNDRETTSWALPDAFRAEDVRLSEDVIERYIQRYTSPGDLVFDPFAGFGTVLVVAERLKRRGIGCEIIEARAAYANSLLSPGCSVVNVDSRNPGFQLPAAKLCLSSPPYMNRTDPENPLAGYTTPVSSYDAFVQELADIYTRIGQALPDDGHLVVQLQNLINKDGATPLAFDLYAAIGRQLHFVGEDVTLWQADSYGYSHGYCLVYAPPAAGDRH